MLVPTAENDRFRFFRDFGGQNPMLAITADKGVLVQTEYQKHPYKREFVFIYAFLSV